MEDKRLITQIEELLDFKAKYMDLLYQVATNHIGETRHETALRYIRNAEHSCNGPEKECNTD